jgi:hypothetical protein
LFFSFSASFSQTKTYTVLDSITHTPIELATVRFLKSDYTVFTNASGNFGSFPNGEIQAEISHVGYKTKVINVNDTASAITLQQSINELSEIVLESKKIKYNTTKHINSDKRDKEYFGFQFGTENCVYIHNKENKRGVISAITLHLSKLRDMNFFDRVLKRDRNCKGCKVDYLASFKISFYEYDTVAKKPGQLLHESVIITDPKNKTYKYTVDLDSLHIPFPKSGICVGVELVNTRYNKPKTTFAIIGPAIGFYKAEVTAEPISWIRYRNEGWNFKNVVTNTNNRPKSNVLIVDLKAKF